MCGFGGCVAMASQRRTEQARSSFHGVDVRQNGLIPGLTFCHGSISVVFVGTGSQTSWCCLLTEELLNGKFQRNCAVGFDQFHSPEGGVLLIVPVQRTFRKHGGTVRTEIGSSQWTTGRMIYDSWHDRCPLMVAPRMTPEKSGEIPCFPLPKRPLEKQLWSNWRLCVAISRQF